MIPQLWTGGHRDSVTRTVTFTDTLTREPVRMMRIAERPPVPRSHTLLVSEEEDR